MARHSMRFLAGTLTRLIFAGALLLPAAVLAQDEKHDAALTPVATLGDISETEKRIIFTRLQSQLSKSYRLVSETDYAAAEELAFEQLEAEACTEEQCIRAIQDILQVERLFALQILREGELTQISLTLVREDDKIVRDDTCDGCSTAQLLPKVEALAAEVIRADLDLEGLVQALPPPLPQPPLLEEADAGIPLWMWIVGGLAVAGVAVAATSSSGGGGGGSSSSGGGGGNGGGSSGGVVGFTY